jgi:hypothetical protein
MKLINNKGITDTHVSTSTTSTLLLINVLMDNVDQLLMQVLVVVRVLK